MNSKLTLEEYDPFLAIHGNRDELTKLLITSDEPFENLVTKLIKNKDIDSEEE